MASFYGKDSGEASRRFEADFFTGDEMFQPGVEPVGRVDRRVVGSDPLLGFDPTSLEPSVPQPPILQPPVEPSTFGEPSRQGTGIRQRPNPDYDMSYEMWLQRQEIKGMEEESERRKSVWG